MGLDKVPTSEELLRFYPNSWQLDADFAKKATQDYGCKFRYFIVKFL